MSKAKALSTFPEGEGKKNDVPLAFPFGESGITMRRLLSPSGRVAQSAERGFGGT